MRILFKHRHWIVIQAIYLIIGILSALIFKSNGKMFGGMAIGLHFISNTQELLIPILSLMLADLAFNVEYVEGTFLTHLLCGKSRTKWMWKRLLTFYLFIVLQFFIAFALISIGSGMVTGDFTLKGIETAGQNPEITKALEEVSSNILKTMVYVALAVRITTFLPGKLMIGSIMSAGIIFIAMKLTFFLMLNFKDSKFLKVLVDMFWLDDPKKALMYGAMWLALLTWLSIKRINKVAITNHGS